MGAASSERGSPDPLLSFRRPERLEAVRETGLHRPETSDSLDYLTTLALRALDCATSFVSVVDDQKVLVRASQGDPEPLLENGFIPVERSFCQNVVARGEPLVVPDSSDEESVGSQLAAQQGLAAYLEVPLHLTEEVVIGGFCVADSHPRDWTDEDVELLETIAAGAASEIRLRREVRRLREREEELEDRAFHDALTGLANRHLLRDRVSHALARSRRTGNHVAVLFADVDDFKSVNDRYGHSAGDEVLAEIARRLRNSVRAHDTPARYGGDEFVILLEDLDDPSQAGRIADRIERVASEPVALADGSVTPSLSMGLAVAGGPEDRGAESEASEVPDASSAPDGLASRGRRLVQEADWAMYRAKRSEGTGWIRY